MENTECSSQLMNAIGEVEAQTRHLRDRLAPVLCAREPETETAIVENTSNTPGSALNDLATTLTVLNDTLNRLEV